MDEQRLPKRTRAHVLETLSRQHVESILPTEWVCRRVEDDYGLDMRVEIVSGESVSGREFAVQLKGTDRLKTSGDDVLHSCKVSTAHYFLQRPEPVMYVVYDAQEDAAYWLWVQPYLRGLDDASPGWRERKEVRVRIPRANRLTREAVPLIAGYVQAWWARVMVVVGQEYPASPADAPRPFQLPPDLVTFTGREEYLDGLDELLRPGSGQTVGLVGLHGTAGVGKSALAVHAAHGWGERFRDGVVWVDLRRRDVASALRHVAATYGYGEQARQVPDAEGLAGLVRTVLRTREALVILDNAERIPAEEFPLLLPGVPGCVALVTSRRSFTELERHGRVLPVGEMKEAEAEALLARILGETTDEEERAARGDLAQRLGGLPLALDIAARLMRRRGWSAGEYLARLKDAPSLVAELCLPLAKRPEDSVAVAFALSYEALERGQQCLFRAVGVMAEGGMAPPAVAGVVGQEPGEVERGLEGLAALSLVRASQVPGRTELHPLLADYSRVLAREAGEWEGLRRAHLAYYVGYAERYTEDYEALEAELGNLMAAGEWSWDSGEHAGVQALAEWLYGSGVHFLDLRGHLREAVQLLGWAAEAARAAGNRRGEGVHLGNLGNAYRNLGEVRRAIEYYEQALAISREIGDRRNEGAWLGDLGLAYAALGEARRAIEYHERCLMIHREIGDRRGEGSALGNLGLTYADLGEVRRAIEYYKHALAIAREIKDRRGEGGHLGNLGLAYADLGEVRRAIEYYEQALAIARETGDRHREGVWLGNLGNAYAALGEVRRVIEYYQQALKIDREIEDRPNEAIHCWNLGLLYEDGDPARAAELMQVCVEYEREIGHPDAEADAESVQGLLDKG
jgi:tetratricopeptide (TPR) repeat protein